MKSILICTSSYPANSSTDGKEAAGAFVAEFAHNLAKTHQVYVVAPGLIDGEETNCNLIISRFKVDSLPLSILSLKRPKDWSRILTTLMRGKRRVNKLASKYNPDHILAFWALPSGYWAKSASQSLGIPYSVWCLGSDIWSLGKIPVVRRVLKNTLLNANHSFADGIQLCKDVEAISARSCTFLPSSRTLSSTFTKRMSTYSPYKLAYLGRWHKNKGIDILLDSLTTISIEDWKLISEVKICGGGPLEQIVEEKYAKLKNGGLPVTLSGFKDKQEATALLQWADYVIIPSRIESIPVIFSDSMQLSCPVICTPVGDLDYLVSRYNVGTTSTDTNPPALAAAIINALKTPPAGYAENLDRAAADFSSKASVQTFIGSIE